MDFSDFWRFEYQKRSAIYFHYICEKADIFTADDYNNPQLTPEQSRWTNSTTGKTKNMYFWFGGKLSLQNRFWKFFLLLFVNGKGFLSRLLSRIYFDLLIIYKTNKYIIYCSHALYVSRALCWESLLCCCHQWSVQTCFLYPDNNLITKQIQNVQGDANAAHLSSW